MPVLSPHRGTTSSAGLSGTYRSTFGTSSSSLDHHHHHHRSTYGGGGGGGGVLGGTSSAYVSPRYGSYTTSERYSTRSYADSNGRSYFSRTGSISTDDGYTSSTRFREESTREGSGRRESAARTQIDALLAADASSSPVRRSLSTTLESTPVRATSVVDSIADLRSKYSASNYVPAVLRNRTTTGRTANSSATTTTTSSEHVTSATSSGKVIESNLNLIIAGHAAAATNNTNNVVHAIAAAAVAAAAAGGGEEGGGGGGGGGGGAAPANVDNMRQHDDDNGNRPNGGGGGALSVLEMTKKFEKRCAPSTSAASTNTASTTTTMASGGLRRGVAASRSVGTSTGNAMAASALTVVSLSAPTPPASRKTPAASSKSSSNAKASSRHNHTNDFASYIPIDAEAAVENGGVAAKTVKRATKDLNSTSPRLNRSPIATANGGGAASNNATTSGGALGGGGGGGSGSNRNSLERGTVGGSSSSSYDSNASTSSNSSSGGGVLAHSHTPAHHLSYERASPTKQMGLNGLKNIGNTCFMNSVLQCLSNTRPLLEYMRREGHAADINTSLSSMKGALVNAFAQVIKELWSEDCSDRVVNTSALKLQIQRFAPRFMGYSQQDAQEFLRYLLEGLHEDINRVKEKPTPIHTEIDERLSDNDKASESWQRYLRRENSKVVDLFVGQFKSTLKCTHCGHCSVTFDPFWDLSLPIPQKTGAIRLSQCLDSFTREETLDGDEKPTCSKCKERRKCTKSFTVHKFPKILVIHLKRFSPTERFRGKLSVTVDFPLEGLDMCGYASEPNVQCRYNLYAVSNHSGTTYNGHYTAYCRHPYSMAWHEYNDSRVSSISSKSIVSGEAYVLFYELDAKMSAHL